MKTAKQKCLEMWEWLADNPQADKSDYYNYLEELGREDEYNLCWACQETLKKYNNSCAECPIQWTEEIQKNKFSQYCYLEDSPYYIWIDNINLHKKKQAALDVIELIKETWEE